MKNGNFFSRSTQKALAIDRLSTPALRCHGSNKKWLRCNIQYLFKNTRFKLQLRDTKFRRKDMANNATVSEQFTTEIKILAAVHSDDSGAFQTGDASVQNYVLWLLRLLNRK